MAPLAAGSVRAAQADPLRRTRLRPADWEVADLSFDSWVADLETVVDAIGERRFPLLGVSQGAAVAVAYAARHPERVSHLVLYGAYGRGRLVRDRSARQLEECKLMLKLIELGWASKSAAFRQVFTAQFIPGGSVEQLQWFNELQRVSTTAANAARFLDAFARIDVMAAATNVRCPTLVLHARDDERAPFDEGRLFAAQIPGARFIPLESANHILLMEPAWDVFRKAVLDFIGEAPPTRAAGMEELTPREQELLELLARGIDNSAIAAGLGLRVETVRNHITRVFDKLGVRTRAEAIVKAREAGLGGGQRTA